MPRHRSKYSSALTTLILITAITLWGYDTYKKSQEPSTAGRPSIKRSEPPSKTNHYEAYKGCTLVPERGNDGDSFRVALPDGRQEIMRLYFVDTPESAFKTYRGNENNYQRIQQQANDMGGITPQQAVEIGKKAKDFTLSHLEKNPFTIYTQWDSPFHDGRYHAFIELNYQSKTRFLHELLVEKGYARIHTKGAPMPDGKSKLDQENHLKSLERIARSQNAGAWGL